MPASAYPPITLSTTDACAVFDVFPNMSTSAKKLTGS